jgi:catechol-2,3-dioxygenase
MLEEGPKHGVQTRGIADHHFIHSIYFRDPNGYVIELTAKLDNHDEVTDPQKNDARGKLDRWQKQKIAGPGPIPR